MSIQVHIYDPDDGQSQDITATLLEAEWRLGMTQPDDHFSAVSWARLTVDNTAGQFTPGTANPLIGRRISITTTDDPPQPYFTGWVSAVTVEPGTLSARRAVIQAEGVERWLHDATVDLPPDDAVPVADAIRDVLRAASLRRDELAGYCIIDSPAHNMIDSVMIFGLDPIASVLPPGSVDVTYPVGTRDISAADLLRQMALVDRGAIAANRDGALQFFPHRRLISTGNTYTMNDNMQGLSLTHGTHFTNHIQVMIQPRHYGTPNTVLWQLSAPQTIPPDTQRIFNAVFRDENGMPVAGADVNSPDVTITTTPTGGTDITWRMGVQVLERTRSALRLAIYNPLDEFAYLTALTITGTPVTVTNPIMIDRRDTLSMSFYGKRTRSLTLDLVGDIEYADSIAEYILTRSSQPHTRITSLTLDAAFHPVDALTLYNRITITETQSGHTGDYHIVSEHHHVGQGGSEHRADYLLSPADENDYVLIDESVIDDGSVLSLF